MQWWNIDSPTLIWLPSFSVLGWLRRWLGHFRAREPFRGFSVQQPLQEEAEIRSDVTGEADGRHTCCSRCRSQRRTLGSNAAYKNRSQSSALPERNETTWWRVAGCERDAVQVFRVFRFLRSPRWANDKSYWRHQDTRTREGLVSNVVSGRHQQHPISIHLGNGTCQGHPRELEP